MKVISIGRSEECSVVINDTKVSRVHLQLVQNDNGNISVVDLGSANGTYVNGVRIVGETPLKTGDELRIGNTLLPWKTYFATHKTDMGEKCKVDIPVRQSKEKDSKNKMLWIILAVVLGMAAVGGVVWMLLGRGSEPTVTDTVSTRDTIYVTDSTNTDYENFLLKQLDEKDSVLKQQSLRQQRNNDKEESVENSDTKVIEKINNAKPTIIGNIYRDLGKKNLMTIDRQDKNYVSIEKDELNKDVWKKEIINRYQKANEGVKEEIKKVVEQYCK